MEVIESTLGMEQGDILKALSAFGVTSPEEVYAAIAIVIITVFVLAWLTLGSKEGKSGNSIILCGLPDSGKSALYFRMLFDLKTETHTSMKVNSHVLQCAKGTKTLVDYPGHLRLRSGISDHLNDAAVIVFVIDSVSLERTLTSNAEFLYNILTDPAIVLRKPAPALLIACTKRDLGHSYKSTVVKRQLEAEMDEIRKTKSSIVTQLGGSKDTLSLGIDSDRFNFDLYSPLATTFIDCAAKDGTGDGITNHVEPLKDWLVANN